MWLAILDLLGVFAVICIRSSNHLAMLAKWAQMVPPPAPGTSAFHEFTYAVRELKILLVVTTKPNII